MVEVDPSTRSCVVDDGTGTVTATVRVADDGDEANNNATADGVPKTGTAGDSQRMRVRFFLPKMSVPSNGQGCGGKSCVMTDSVMPEAGTLRVAPEPFLGHNGVDSVE